MENKSKTTPIWKNNKGLIIAFSVLCVVLVAVPTILYLNMEGPQGIHGLVGQTGPQGVHGLVGQTGPQGETGLTGPQGIHGLVGQTGPRGETGTTGPQGIHGLVGQTGPQGENGLVGQQGIQGPSGGERGAKGDQGIQGDTGGKGEQGIQGDTGGKGEQGIQGDTGGKGDTGEIDQGTMNIIKYVHNVVSITKSTWYSQVMNVRLDIEKKADIDKLTKEFVDVHGITNYAELFTEIRLYTGLDEKLMPDAKLIFVFDTSLLEDYANIDKPIDSSTYDRFFVAKDYMLADIKNSGTNSNVIFADDNHNPNASYRASYYKHDAIFYYGDKVVGDTSAWEE